MASLGSHCEECPEQTDRPAGHDRHKGGAEIYHRCDRTEEQPSQNHFNYNHHHHSCWWRLGRLGPPEPHNALILWDPGTAVRCRCDRHNQEADSELHNTHTPQAGTQPGATSFRSLKLIAGPRRSSHPRSRATRRPSGNTSQWVAGFWPARAWRGVLWKVLAFQWPPPALLAFAKSQQFRKK